MVGARQGERAYEATGDACDVPAAARGHACAGRGGGGGDRGPCTALDGGCERGAAMAGCRGPDRWARARAGRAVSDETTGSGGIRPGRFPRSEYTCWRSRFSESTPLPAGPPGVSVMGYGVQCADDSCGRVRFRGSRAPDPPMYGDGVVVPSTEKRCVSACESSFMCSSPASLAKASTGSASGRVAHNGGACEPSSATSAKLCGGSANIGSISSRATFHLQGRCG